MNQNNNNSIISYKKKYLKYKEKYLQLKKTENTLLEQSGGRLEQSTGKPKLVLFKAEWCGHCSRFKPTWEELKNKITNVDFVTYDADSNQSELSTYNVEGFPTIILDNNNKKIEYNGDRSSNNIIQFVNDNLN